MAKIVSVNLTTKNRKSHETGNYDIADPGWDFVFLSVRPALLTTELPDKRDFRGKGSPIGWCSFAAHAAQAT